MDKQHLTSAKEINEVEWELRLLAKMMIQLLTDQKHQGKINEEEYNRLVAHKIKFLS